MSSLGMDLLPQRLLSFHFQLGQLLTQLESLLGLLIKSQIAPFLFSGLTRERIPCASSSGLQQTRSCDATHRRTPTVSGKVA